MKIFFSLSLALFALCPTARAQDVTPTPTVTPTLSVSATVPTSATAPASPTIARLVSDDVPLSLQIGSLNATWRRISLEESSTRIDKARDEVNQSLMVVNLMEAVLGAQDAIFWTQWRTVSSGNDSFLVVYRVRDFDEDSIENLFPSNRKIAPTTAQFMATIPKWMRERPLDLVLVNLKTVKIIDGAQPFDFEAQVARVRLWADKNLAVAPPKPLPRRTQTDDLRELALSIALYAQDNDDTIPPLNDIASFKKAVATYIKSATLWRPQTKPFYTLNPILSGKKIAHISRPADMISIYETQADAKGAREVGFLDGSVRRLDETQWLKYQRGSKINEPELSRHSKK